MYSVTGANMTLPFLRPLYTPVVKASSLTRCMPQKARSANARKTLRFHVQTEMEFFHLRISRPESGHLRRTRPLFLQNFFAANLARRTRGVIVGFGRPAIVWWDATAERYVPMVPHAYVSPFGCALWHMKLM